MYMVVIFAEGDIWELPLRGANTPKTYYTLRGALRHLRTRAKRHNPAVEIIFRDTPLEVEMVD